MAGAGREWTVICDAEKIHSAAMAHHLGATLLDDTVASLDEIFVAHADQTDMRSPTTALLWEIWRQHRWTVAVVAVLTVAGRLIDFIDTGGRAGDAGPESSPLPILLAMIAFLLLLGIFNYTEPSGNRGIGCFPRRLFTLPVTSLRLVTVPLLAGIASIELLYLLWMDPLSRGGSASAPFVAVLLAALIVFYLWALWSLERLGSLRLIMLGVIAVALFSIGMLPSFPPTPPPPWRSEIVLAGLVAGVAVVMFLLTWRHVARLRAGGGRSADRAGSLSARIAEAAPTRRRPFASPAAAHFWFEWRSSGMVLPALVGSLCSSSSCRCRGWCAQTRTIPFVFCSQCWQRRSCWQFQSVLRFRNQRSGRRTLPFPHSLRFAL